MKSLEDKVTKLEQENKRLKDAKENQVGRFWSQIFEDSFVNKSD